MAWVVEIPPPDPRSTLPIGGSPADDRAYLAWRDAFLVRAGERDIVRRWHDAANDPLVIDAVGLDGFLFRAFGERPMFGTQDIPIYNHRLRFLAITFRDRPAMVIAEAERFIGGITNGV